MSPEEEKFSAREMRIAARDKLPVKRGRPTAKEAKLRGKPREKGKWPEKEKVVIAKSATAFTTSAALADPAQPIASTSAVKVISIVSEDTAVANPAVPVREGGQSAAPETEEAIAEASIRALPTRTFPPAVLEIDRAYPRFYRRFWACSGGRGDQFVQSLLSLSFP
jgi:hypothetical protein